MKDLITSILAGVAVFSGVVGIFCVCVAVTTAVWYYLVNFVLSAFNTGYEITWLQALAVAMVVTILRSGANKSKE